MPFSIDIQQQPNCSRERDRPYTQDDGKPATKRKISHTGTHSSKTPENTGLIIEENDSVSSS